MSLGGGGAPLQQTPPAHKAPSHTVTRQAGSPLTTNSSSQQRSHSSLSCLHLPRDRQPSIRPSSRAARGRRERPGEDAGKRQEGVQGGSAGEEERRAAAALEEEALRPDRGRRVAAAAKAARPAASPPAASRRRGQSQGAALRQHEDGGLRGAEGQVRVLHGGHDGGEGDRLQVPAGRGLERGDHLADGAVQEPAGDPGRQVHPAEAAAARRADARPEDAPQLAQRSVTCGESRGQRRAISGKTAKERARLIGGRGPQVRGPSGDPLANPGLIFRFCFIPWICVPRKRTPVPIIGFSPPSQIKP